MESYTPCIRKALFFSIKRILFSVRSVLLLHFKELVKYNMAKRMKENLVKYFLYNITVLSFSRYVVQEKKSFSWYKTNFILKL